MDKTPLWTNIVTFLGGGFVVYLLDLYFKSGKIKVDDYSLKLTYVHTHDFKKYVFFHLELDIQFINTSGHSKIINNISAVFFDGQNNHNLSFDGYSVPPAEVIPPKEVVCLQFCMRDRGGNFYFPTNTNAYYVEVSFKLNNKPKKLKIEGTKLQLNNTTGTALVF